MASIHFSKSLAHRILEITFGTSYLDVPADGYCAGLCLSPPISISYHGYFRIFKGTVPTDFSWMVDSQTYPTRAADKLIEWSAHSPDWTFTLTYPSSEFIFNCSPKTATASGTATFFHWGVKKGESYAYGNQVIGTVGVTGSGADLEIPDTNIISGNNYRITNAKWKVPTGFSY